MAHTETSQNFKSLFGPTPGRTGGLSANGRILGCSFAVDTVRQRDSQERLLDARVTGATEFRRTSRGEEGEMADVWVMATGLRFPEGPVAMADGSVVLGEIAGSAVTRVAPDGSKTAIGAAGGGPNGLARGPD